MRIDDKNKTIWMKESVSDELMLKLKKYNCISKLIEISRFSGKYGIPVKQNDREWKDITSAVFDGYKFESESNKKYYWRKKKEYLAWFEEEKQNSMYLTLNDEDGRLSLSSSYENGYYRTMFTVEEAKGLLKDDFDKFEKVKIKESKQ